MTDRELLERAAKAAGYASWDWLASDGTMNVYYADGTQEVFDPLNEDGEALRLAAQCEIDIRHYRKHVDCCAEWKKGAPIIAEYGKDRAAATRRAIVRAAAETVSATLPRHSEQMSDK